MRVHGKNGFSDDVMNMLGEEDEMASYFRKRRSYKILAVVVVVSFTLSAQTRYVVLLD